MDQQTKKAEVVPVKLQFGFPAGDSKMCFIVNRRVIAKRC